MAMPRGDAMNRSGAANRLKHATMFGAACVYVLAGYMTFRLSSAFTDDADIATLVAACMSIPLAAPLFYVIGWIEKRL